MSISSSFRSCLRIILTALIPLHAVAIESVPPPLRSPFVQVQNAIALKQYAVAEDLINRMENDPLKPWAQGLIALSNDSTPSTILEQLASKVPDSLMEKRLLDQAAFASYKSGQPKESIRLLNKYKGDLSASAQCTTWLSNRSQFADSQTVQTILIAGANQSSCKALILLLATESVYDDLVSSSLLLMSNAAKQPLLVTFSQNQSPLLSPSHPFNIALLARKNLNTGANIPRSMPLLRAAAWSLSAQSAFANLDPSILSIVPINELNKEGAWAIFRLALYQKKAAAWESALRHLSVIDADNSRFLFWDALLLHPENVNHSTLLKRNNYHAFVLREALGLPLFYKTGLSSAQTSPRIKDSNKNKKCAASNTLTPILLFKAGASSEAFLAWRFVLNRSSEAEQHCLFELAKSYAATPLALAAINKLAAKTDEDIQMQWMIGEKDALEMAARQEGVWLALLAALTRQESRYDPHAISAVGALGLTQLMPSTAQDLVRKAKIPMPDLLSPIPNATLGARYFRQKLQRLSDPRWASAAYNAGEKRALVWKERFKDYPWILGVELIPFEETRGYVERIYEGWAAHEELSAGPYHHPLSSAASSTRQMLKTSKY